MDPKQSTVAKQALRQGKPMAVRIVELSHPLQPLRDLQNHWGARIFLSWRGTPIGSVDLANEYQSVTVESLTEAIVADPELAQTWEELKEDAPAPVDPSPTFESSVSVIIPTCDRPDDLRNCLQNLEELRTHHRLEIIVIDNRPGSGLTSPVVQEFPNVKLVCEHRPGASYARNTGVAHAQGEIIVTIDDDVTPSRHWLDPLVAPFARPKVMVVTGNILPLELETPAQQAFEIYADGGLCRGFQPFEVDRGWLESSTLASPVWLLGGTANAAFRASLFRHPEIGLWEEMLGAGVPAGGGEDIYLFYKNLRAGFVHIYEPKAWVWHRHRRRFPALRYQIYSYSRGVMAYHLMTVAQCKDWRPFLSIAMLPTYYAKRFLWRLLGRLTYPMPLLMLEIIGHSQGLWALWRSHQHVQRYGRSSRLPTS